MDTTGIGLAAGVLLALAPGACLLAEGLALAAVPVVDRVPTPSREWDVKGQTDYHNTGRSVR